MEKYEIINYINGENNIELRVDFDNKTAWISIEDMSVLFNRDHSLINKYVKTLLKGNVELTSSSMAKFATQLLPGRVVDVTKENTRFNIGRSRAKFAQHLPDGRVFEVICYNLDVVEQLSLKFSLNQYEKLKNLLTTRQNELNQDFNKIIIFYNGNITLDVRISPYEKTVWLSEKQIADLFGTTRQNINLHVQNIIKDNELDPISVSKDYLHTAQRRTYGKIRNYQL